MRRAIMARRRSLATLVLLIVSTILSSATFTLQVALAGEPGKLVIGYLASWKAAADKILVPSLPARHLTHIYLAFGVVSEAGRVTSLIPVPWPGVVAAGKHQMPPVACSHNLRA